MLIFASRMITLYFSQSEPPAALRERLISDSAKLGDIIQKADIKFD